MIDDERMREINSDPVPDWILARDPGAVRVRDGTIFGSDGFQIHETAQVLTLTNDGWIEGWGEHKQVK